jgi:hypothetical protein
VRTARIQKNRAAPLSWNWLGSAAMSLHGPLVMMRIQWVFLVSGWNPRKRMEFVSWDNFSQYMEIHKTCSKPPTRFACVGSIRLSTSYKPTYLRSTTRIRPKPHFFQANLRGPCSWPASRDSPRGHGIGKNDVNPILWTLGNCAGLSKYKYICIHI